MKTIHTTIRAKAQQAVEDAQAERLGYERYPSEVMDIHGPDDQEINCLLEDIEEYAESMDADDESQQALNEKQYDMLVENTADADAFTGFLEWLKAEEMIPSDDQFDACKSFGSPLEAIEYACSFGGSYADKVARAMKIVTRNVETSEFGFASEVVREIETIE